MLVFWSLCLSSPVCLSVSQTSMDDSGDKRVKYRTTLQFKSSGCAVSNITLIIYDSSLSLSISIIPKLLIQQDFQNRALVFFSNLIRLRTLKKVIY